MDLWVYIYIYIWRFQNTSRKRVPENAASGKASGKLPEHFRKTRLPGKLPESFRKTSGTRRRKYINSGTHYQMYMSGFFEIRHIYIYIYVYIHIPILSDVMLSLLHGSLLVIACLYHY